MIWLGERLVDIGMWFRREPANYLIGLFYGIGVSYLVVALIVAFIR